MAKKSKAQIKRMMKRAEARGEVYEQPPAEEAAATTTTISSGVGDGQPRFAPAVEAVKDAATNQNNSSFSSTEQNDDSTANKEKLRVARKLKTELQAIEADTSLRSKERRSAKRKAEAIALEASGVQATELLAWYEEQSATNSKDADDSKEKRQGNPYIVFIGQLSYDTTKESIFEHIREQLGGDHEITKSTVKIRLLTDSKTTKSRGMAFVEVSDPELLYSLLKLHHTMLDGRRINVERSAGGGRNSENRKLKLKQYRVDQEEHMQSVVAGMIDEYKQRGEIKDSELDEVAVSVCQRHSASIVSAALEKYVESNGRDMDNPSSYFTFLLGKLASEGIYEDKKTKDENQRKGKNKRSFSNKNDHSRKRPTKDFGAGSGFEKDASVFSKQGIDMQTSSSGEPDLGKIFPSMSRGRGRGR